MFIELVESLRCIAPHEDSWLVAATRRMAGRSIVDGTLGCPVCRRSYTIAGGVAYFGVAADDQSVAANDARESPPAPTEEESIRLAALLGLTSTGGIVVLAGAWALHADALTAIAPGVRLLLLDPPIAIRGNDDDSASRDGTVSIVRAAGDALPLAAGAARAVALDVATATAARLDAAVRALAGGGRIVAPVAVTVPAGVRELARDAEVWVAEREAAVARESGPVPLRRTRRS